MSNKITTDIDTAIGDLKAGKILIVIDDEDRENEGDFIMAAEKVTPEAINFMTKFGRGMVCLALTEDRAEELELEYMVERNTALHGTAFTVTIDARVGTTTGVSAYDRALTIQKAIDPETNPEDLARPGHIFPLISKPGGVLRRAGHTEAVVDLARMAGLRPEKRCRGAISPVRRRCWRSFLTIPRETRKRWAISVRVPSSRS